MALTYDPIFAADPNNAANVASNASIIIFDPNDPGKSPITITDVTGSPLPNPITVNKNGFGPAFQHATLDRVGWFGAGFTGYFTSYEGMKAEATAAKTAAQTAAATAGTEAAAAATAAIGTATDDAEAAAASAATAASNASASATAAANAAALVGAPADSAIAAAINGAGATKTALNATYVPRWKANTAYLAGDKVLSPTGEVVSAKVGFTSGASYAAADWDGAVFNSLPNGLVGIASRGPGPSNSRQITVKAAADTTDGLFDWRNDSARGYLFHLTLGPNSTANTYALAIGIDEGMGRGILLANKKTGIGLVINQQSSITSGTAYGVQGQQNSTVAPLMSLEQYAVGAASVLTLRSSLNAPSNGQKIFEVTGQPGGTFTSWGSISAFNGALNWEAPINANAGVFVVRATAGDNVWMSKMAVDGTDTANYRLKATANGAMTWSDGIGMSTGPSLSRNGTALQLNNVFQLNGGLRWGQAALIQTTVGAAGAAAALPASPTKYLKIQDETGTTYVIPAFAAA